MLPRWQEAFVGAKISKPGTWRSPKDVSNVGLVWFRLARGRPVSEQILEVSRQLTMLPFVALSDMPSDDEALAAFAAGARGYCNTHSNPLVLQQIAAVAQQGGLWIGESLMQRLVSATSRVPVAVASGATSPDWDVTLTERERQVAQTLATGSSNKEIARTLGITERTVKSHVGAVLEKLKVRDRLQLSLLINTREKP